jgi:TetR/AcrR family transcriptional regulator, transcriptional repressor of aconitase
MPKVSQSYLNARRSQILEAAIVCFSRDGFHRTTMQNIVKESKLSPGAIYNYFESKEEIIEAIANERHAKEHLLVTEARKESDVASVLKRIRDAFFGELRNPKDAFAGASVFKYGPRRNETRESSKLCVAV